MDAGDIMKRLITLLTVASALLLGTAHAATDFETLKSQARSGDVAAQLALAEAYRNEKSDLRNALKWYEAAAAAGNAEAQYQLSRMGSVKGGPDSATAQLWLEKAAAQDHAASVKQLCQFYSVRKDWAKAVPMCHKAEPQNIAAAYITLGEAYMDGLGGVAANGGLASRYLEAALAQPNLSASVLADLHLRLALLLSDGRLLPADPVKALPHLQLSLFSSPLKVGPYLANIYEKGLSTPPDPLEAARLYIGLGQLGSPEAAQWLSLHRDQTLDVLKAHNLNPPMDYQVPGEGDEHLGAAWNSQTGAELYPVRAMDAELSGDALISCRWNEMGRPDNCLLLEENPPGYGFGQASHKRIQLSLMIRDKPLWLKQIAGKSLLQRIRWTLQPLPPVQPK